MDNEIRASTLRLEAMKSQFDKHFDMLRNARNFDFTSISNEPEGDSSIQENVDLPETIPQAASNTQHPPLLNHANQERADLPEADAHAVDGGQTSPFLDSEVHPHTELPTTRSSTVDDRLNSVMPGSAIHDHADPLRSAAQEVTSLSPILDLTDPDENLFRTTSQPQNNPLNPMPATEDDTDRTEIFTQAMKDVTIDEDVNPPGALPPAPNDAPVSAPLDVQDDLEDDEPAEVDEAEAQKLHSQWKIIHRTNSGHAVHVSCHLCDRNSTSNGFFKYKEGLTQHYNKGHGFDLKFDQAFKASRKHTLTRKEVRTLLDIDIKGSKSFDPPQPVIDYVGPLDPPAPIVSQYSLRSANGAGGKHLLAQGDDKVHGGNSEGTASETPKMSSEDRNTLSKLHEQCAVIKCVGSGQFVHFACHECGANALSHNDGTRGSFFNGLEGLKRHYDRLHLPKMTRTEVWEACAKHPLTEEQVKAICNVGEGVLQSVVKPVKMRSKPSNDRDLSDSESVSKRGRARGRPVETKRKRVEESNEAAGPKLKHTSADKHTYASAEDTNTGILDDPVGGGNGVTDKDTIAVTRRNAHNEHA